MSFLERIFKIRKRNEGLRLMYADDAESVSSDLTYEDTQSNEEEGQDENNKEENPKRRTDFLNELFF